MPDPSRHRGLTLIVLTGDQLDADSPVLQSLDPARDIVWMAEVTGESTHVWSSKPRIAFFLAAMRHFRELLQKRGVPLHYQELHADSPDQSLEDALDTFLQKNGVSQLRVIRPGEWRVLHTLETLCRKHGIAMDLLEDPSFYDSPASFARHAQGRRSLRMEFFYREMRKTHRVLMDGEEPAGGRWNFDEENRESFDKAGPQGIAAPPRFPPDRITRSVIKLVNLRFASHPGSLQDFSWPVTRQDALHALDDFICHRLGKFGPTQDAMWTDEPFLYHSLLSPALNVKLLQPREVVDRAETAWREGRAPLSSVEGFIRQILGWREYVRGIYWHFMPDYIENNALKAEEPLPDFYWTANTGYACLHHTLQQTLHHGYAHHIQRLMVTGLYALLLGVNPRHLHAWYLAVYVDAVEWVELPNTLGMSQYADGGMMASKPYVATGKYLARMSNYCQHCPQNPALATGPKACPFTTLYWDFLFRHRKALQSNPRMSLQLRNLDRKSDAERRDIENAARAIRKNPSGPPASPRQLTLSPS